VNNPGGNWQSVHFLYGERRWKIYRSGLRQLSYKVWWVSRF